MKKIVTISLSAFLLCLGISLNQEEVKAQNKNDMKTKVEQYAQVKLTSNISYLSSNEKQVLGLFIDAAKIMDDIYWKQTFGNKQDVLKIKDRYTREFAMINYGYWDRLDGMKPFVKGVKDKPLGAMFYPKDMTETRI
jgi:hypothetical protein